MAVRLAREGRTAAARALAGGDPVELLAILLLDRRGKLKLKPATLDRLASHPDPRVRSAAAARLAARTP